MNIENRKIKELKPNDENPRTITRAEMEKLKRSIQEFGFVQPILVNTHPERKDVVIGGHQRLTAAEQLGIKEVPVTYVNLDKTKESLLNIALNRISGDWDDEKLFNLLSSLTDTDRTLSGFDEAVIDEILAKNKEYEKEKTLDDLPATPNHPKTKPGDVFTLGNHKIMCGDSTNPDDVINLMRGEIADAVFTDPPYGVSYKGTNNPNGKAWGVMANDGLRDDDLYKFLVAVFHNYAKHTKENPAVYCCYASKNHTIFETALQNAGFEVKQQLIWEKGHVLGHSDYHWAHEPLLYAIKHGNNCAWLGDRTHKTTILQSKWEEIEKQSKEELLDLIKRMRETSDLISIKKDNVQDYVHSTQKPVELPRSLIKNNTRPGDLIMDLFSGSGSTLMACEVSERKARVMEIEPKYVDVAIIRWQKYTGKDATRQDNIKFNDIK